MRPMTFSGTISPIIAGTAIAALKGPIRIDLFFVLLAAALLVQISANFFNDYFDFKHVQDWEKWEEAEETTPLTKPLHHHIPFAAGGSIILAIILGVWLSVESTWWLAVIGSFGILAGLGYSAGERSFSAVGLGEFVASIFLGFVPMLISYLSQGHGIDLQILAAAGIYALLISTMILTNNIRDINKDTGFRRTVAMRLGKKKAVGLLIAALIAIYSWTAILIILRVVPLSSSIVIFAIPVALHFLHCFRPEATREDEVSAMGWAGKHHWTFGFLFAIGIWFGLF